MGSGIKSKTAKARLANFFRWILIIFFAAYTLFPLLWLVISSFKTNYEFLAESPFSLPQVWQVENYVKALEVAGLGRMLLNSVVVGLVATLINVVIASMSGYCISRFNFRGKEKMFLLFTIGILVPLNALMPTKKLKNWTLVARPFQRRLQNCPLKQCRPRRSKSFPIILTTGTALSLTTKEKLLTA